MNSYQLSPSYFGMTDEEETRRSTEDLERSERSDYGSHETHGSSGSSGSSSSSGSHGSHGSSGNSGSHGSSGSHGRSSSSGSSGSHGIRGSSSSSGSHGIHGSYGSSGSHGIHGSSGSHGIHGSYGSSGNSGNSLSTGSSGIFDFLLSSGSHGSHGISESSLSSGSHGNSGSSSSSGSHGIHGNSLSTLSTGGLGICDYLLNPESYGSHGISESHGIHGSHGSSLSSGNPGHSGNHTDLSTNIYQMTSGPQPYVLKGEWEALPEIFENIHTIQTQSEPQPEFVNAVNRVWVDKVDNFKRNPTIRNIVPYPGKQPSHPYASQGKQKKNNKKREKQHHSQFQRPRKVLGEQSSNVMGNLMEPQQYHQMMQAGTPAVVADIYQDQENVQFEYPAPVGGMSPTLDSTDNGTYDLTWNCQSTTYTCSVEDAVKLENYCLPRGQQDPSIIMPACCFNITPALSNGVFQKPDWNLTMLIYVAMKNSPYGYLEVDEIYEFITYHFPYYLTANKSWKNSIRHNLASRTAFDSVRLEDVEGIKAGKKKTNFKWLVQKEKIAKLDEAVYTWRNSGDLAGLAFPYLLDEIEAGEVGIPEKHRKIQAQKLKRVNRRGVAQQRAQLVAQAEYRPSPAPSCDSIATSTTSSTSFPRQDELDMDIQLQDDACLAILNRKEDDEDTAQETLHLQNNGAYAQEKDVEISKEDEAIYQEFLRNRNPDQGLPSNF